MLWDGRPYATKCEECEKDGKVYVERVRFQTPMNTRIWAFLKMAMHFVSTAAIPLFHSHRSRRELHGLVAAFLAFCHRFCFCTSLLALPGSHHKSLPFRRCNIETASTALGTINLLRKFL